MIAHPTPHSKSKGRLKRATTEAHIIDAFHAVVTREGLRNVRVNDVIKEAGIGKGLLYNYFGGLPGLVKAWGEAYKIWPDREELLGLAHSGTPPPEAAEQLKEMVINHANCLRKHPLRTELLAEQFLKPTAISDALTEVRAQLGTEHRAVFARTRIMEDADRYSLAIILMAAASYLSMRAAHGMGYMGEDIESEEGWSILLKRFERLIDQVTLAADLEKKVKDIPSL